LATTLTRIRRTTAFAIAHLLILGAALLISPAGTASAQADLPAPIIQSTALTDAQKQEIASYANAGLALFRSDTWSEARRGRDQILLPLSDAGVSVAFRLEYSRLLTDAMKAAAAKGQPDVRRLNALRVLGAIATAQSTGPIADHFADTSPSIRFMAAQAAGSAFRALATSSPALPSGDAVRLVNGLAKLVASDADIMVFDGAVIALVEATRVDQSGYGELRDAAFTQMAQTVGARVRAMPTDTTDETLVSAVLRAGIASRDGLSIARTQASDAVSKELAGFGGDLIAYVLRRAQSGQMPPPGSGTLRSALEQLVSVGEANIFFALLNLKASRDPTTLADTLKSGAGDAERSFVDQATTLLRTTLTGAPLSFAADRFIK